LAEEYPQVEIYIDVHRDSALAGVSTTLNSNDTSYAKSYRQRRCPSVQAEIFYDKIPVQKVDHPSVLGTCIMI